MSKLNKGLIENFFSRLQLLDWFIIILVTVISIISLITISSLDVNNQNLFEKHLLRIVFSFVVFLIVASINIKVWYKFSYFFMLL
mgnify:CR=1 FL=1